MNEFGDRAAVPCLACGRPVRVDAMRYLDGAGVARVSFGYGSRYDQGPPGGPSPPGTPDALAETGRVRAAVCDACFARHLDRFWVAPPPRGVPGEGA